MDSSLAHFDGTVNKNFVEGVYRDLKKTTFNAKSLSAKMDSMEHASLNLTGIEGIRDVDKDTFSDKKDRVASRVLVARSTISLYNKQMCDGAAEHFGLEPEKDNYVCRLCKDPKCLKCTRDHCPCKDEEIYPTHEPCTEPCHHLAVSKTI